MTHATPPVRFSDTCLFKIQTLKNVLDRIFDETLRSHASTTLSQFTLLLTVSEHGAVNQRKAAQVLGVSPAAINRQVVLAIEQGLLQFDSASDGRGQALRLTALGEEKVTLGISTVDRRLSGLFSGESRQMDLMSHIVQLLDNARRLVEQQSESAERNQPSHKEEMDMSNQVPKARALFRGDINDAVIRVQKLTGIEITPAWWDKNVGNNGSTESILDRFDKAYEQEVARRRGE